MPTFDVSVVIPTYNRCGLLAGAIETLLQQETGNITFELIIVDNNSTDQTRSVVESYTSHAAPNLRYVVEKRQGVSYARNAGVAAARGYIIAFADDDIRFPKDWVKNIKQSLDRYPDAVYVGGRVLPKWEAPPPPWAGPNLAPFALQDYGASARYVSKSWPVCLISANLACRRELFDVVGPWDLKTQRVKDSIGTLEDQELQMRVWAAGLRGVYVPEVVVTAVISKQRLRKAYHRSWHFGHGRFLSLLRDPSFEAASWRFLDVPAHVYRKTVVHLFNSLGFRLQRGPQQSFRQECDFWRCVGFISHRWTCYFSAGRSAVEHARSEGTN